MGRVHFKYREVLSKYLLTVYASMARAGPAMAGPIPPLTGNTSAERTCLWEELR